MKNEISMGDMLSYIMERFGADCITSCHVSTENQFFEIEFVSGGKRNRIECRDMDAYEERMKNILQKPVEG